MQVAVLMQRRNGKDGRYMAVRVSGGFREAGLRLQEYCSKVDVNEITDHHRVLI